MTLKRKIITWTLLTILCIPAYMIFNNNSETVYINLIGLVYAFATVHICKRIMPRWMIDYITDTSSIDR